MWYNFVGASHLSSPIAKVPKGLIHLNLSHCGLSSKGVNQLAHALSLNKIMPSTLTYLNLSGNNLKEEINVSSAHVKHYSSRLSKLNTVESQFKILPNFKLNCSDPKSPISKWWCYCVYWFVYGLRLWQQLIVRSPHGQPSALNQNKVPFCKPPSLLSRNGDFYLKIFSVFINTIRYSV